MHKIKILGISGSLRNKSGNMYLLESAKSLAPKNVEFDIFDNIGKLPFFNPDLDGAVGPQEVESFRDKIKWADALLISTPEYAHGIPGALKNALDWLVSSEVFLNKRIGILFGSAGDSSAAKEALLEVLRTMSCQINPKTVCVITGIRSKLDSNGEIKEQKLKDEIKSVLEELARSKS